MKTMVTIAVTLLIALAEYAAIAQEDGTSPPKTPQEQQLRDLGRRISKGYKSGKLTDDEAEKLRAKHFEIRLAIRAALADGTITEDEAKRIGELQAKLGDEIKREASNGQTSEKRTRMEARQFKQRMRIRNGVKDGSLTETEADH